jgi:DGQHR domain-containing protein
MSRTNGRGTKAPTLFPPEELRVPALRMRQGRDRMLYAFAIDGKRVKEFAAVSRLGRDEGRRVVGYQRPEVVSHIAEIRAYLETENPMLPSAVVIAFDPTVRFEPHSQEGAAAGPSIPGNLVIPIPADAATRKPGWIVDGQQRLAAVREANLPDGFPVWVVGFLAASDAEQREQFILVNNTKPLPKGLVYELLPATDTRLPTALDKRRFPVTLLNRLNLDEDSPLRGLVKTPTMPEGLIKDNSLIKVIENSLTDGILYRLRVQGDEADADAMLRVLKAYWGAVAAVFPEAWRRKPRESRLLHGAGVVALGFVMDAISDRVRESGIPVADQFRADLMAIRPVCRWTEGHWEFGPNALRKWNEVQNTPKDIQVLANYLLAQYKRLVWNAAGDSAGP